MEAKLTEGKVMKYYCPSDNIEIKLKINTKNRYFMRLSLRNFNLCPSLIFINVTILPS